MDGTGEDSEAPAAGASDADPDPKDVANPETVTEAGAPAEAEPADARPMGDDGGDPAAASSPEVTRVPEATSETAADGAETATPPTTT